MGVAINRCLRRSAVVESLVEEWKLAHNEAMHAVDIEELCHECLDLCALWKHAWQHVTTLLLCGKLNNTDEVGEALSRAVAGSVRAITHVLSAADEIMARDFEMKGAAELKTGLRDMEAILSKIAEKWPFTNKKLIAESRAAIARGEYQEIEELLDECKGACASAG